MQQPPPSADSDATVRSSLPEEPSSALLAAAHRWKRARDSDQPAAAAETLGTAAAAEAGDDIPTCAPTRVRLPNGWQIWGHAPAELMYIYDEIFNRAVYFPNGSGVQLARGSTKLVVDVGANVGLFSLWIAQHAPSYQVLALEPARRSFELLQRNVDERGHSQRIACLQLALGAEARGEAELTWYSAMPGNATLFPEAKEREVHIAFRPERHEAMLRSPGTAVELCEMATLSQVLRTRGYTVGGPAPLSDATTGEPTVAASEAASEAKSVTKRQPLRPIALLKIDVEGAEVDVLRGIEDEDWRRIEQVAVETHSVFDREEVVAILCRRYEEVGEVADQELEACGLDRKIVYARDRIQEAP